MSRAEPQPRLLPPDFVDGAIKQLRYQIEQGNWEQMHRTIDHIAERWNSLSDDEKYSDGNDVLERNVAELSLSQREIDALERAGITTAGHLKDCLEDSSLAGAWQIGRTTRKHAAAALRKWGLEVREPIE